MRFVEGSRRGELFRGQVLQAAVRAFGVVIDPPVFNDLLRFADAGEPMLVQAFFAVPPVEAFDVGVLRRLAGVDEIELNAMIVSPSNQAEGLIEALTESELVTTEYLDKRLAEMRAAIIQWTAALLLGQAGLIIALQQLFG